jgi:uncharacterized protein (TIGR00369 family)
MELRRVLNFEKSKYTDDINENYYFEQINEEYKASAFWRFYGIEMLHIGKGSAELRLPLDMDRFANPRGVVHGGVASSLLDSVSGVSIKTMIEQSQSVATLNLSVNYTRPGIGGAMIAKGKVVTAGKRIATVSGEIYDEQEHKLLATSSGTFMIF